MFKTKRSNRRRQPRAANIPNRRQPVSLGLVAFAATTGVIAGLVYASMVPADTYLEPAGDSEDSVASRAQAPVKTTDLSLTRDNQTFQTFSDGKYNSKFHIYASDLDWSRPVGLLIYADGSGEYGLKNPDSDYLLAGESGLKSVARKHNMVLLTPFSPNLNCSDSGGSCWYLGDPVGYTSWLETLVETVYSNYQIDKSRVVFGGYSSGAQLATEYWLPSGAAERAMTDGLIVAVSYGGSPKMVEVGYGKDFKSNVHIHWNTGQDDSSYKTASRYGVMAGYDHYSQAGFSTSLEVIPDTGHSRWGDFGVVMDSQINLYVD